MKLLLSALAIASLGAGAAACGGGGASSSVARQAVDRSVVVSEPIVAVSRRLGPLDADDYGFLERGQVTVAAQRHRILALIKRYYAVAAAMNGAAACAMLYSATAIEVVAERDDWGARGKKTCAAVMSRIFQRNHRQILADVRSLKVVRVRTDQLDAYLVMYGSGLSRPREFSLRRVGGAWKIGQPLDGELR